MVAETVGGIVALRWNRGEARFLAWGDASFAVMLLVGGAVIFTQRPVNGALFAALSLLPGWVSARAFAIVRSPSPELALRSGNVELRHPLVERSLLFAAGDVHSLWIGPFEQAPPTKRDRWIGRRRFPACVVDVSDRRRTDSENDVLLVAFTRTLTLRPRLRIPSPVWALHRAWPGLVGRQQVNGLVAVVQDREAAMATVQASGLTRAAMPDDVRSWLS